MDTATRDRNIATWLGDAPQLIRDTTNQLLERIALLRAEQTIYPAQDDILNALAYTPADQVKVVILGQDPYHGPNQAMGLSFSVPATQTKLPPSLRNIYKELDADLDCPIPATCAHDRSAGTFSVAHARRETVARVLDGLFVQSCQVAVGAEYGLCAVVRAAAFLLRCQFLSTFHCSCSS
mgnify:CR=1 FL=1